MKKIALCLYGVPPFEKVDRDINDYESIKSWENNYNKENMDVYMHCWSNNDIHINKLLDVFKPVKYKMEPQKDFGYLGDIKTNPSECFGNANRHKSRHYSMKEVVNMVDKEYDMIILSRIDIVWFAKIDFTTCDENKFTIGNWTTPHHMGIDIYGNVIEGILCFYHISNQFNITKFANEVYDDYDNILKESQSTDSHVFQSYYLNKVGFNKILDYKHSNLLEFEVEWKTRYNSRRIR